MDNDEQLPVSSARLIAILALVMGLIFPVVIYFFFIKSSRNEMEEGGIFPLLIIMVVVFMDYIALKKISNLFKCEQCHNNFFAGKVLAIFKKPEKCYHCEYKSNSVVEK